MRVMNHMPKPFIEISFVVYLDDILIYSPSYETHKQHLWQVLESLTKEELYANMKKCTFCTDHAIFLGNLLSSAGIRVDQSIR